jgi:UDP:flavonoid glycosyltransferase YjiC (YdhE family)
VPGYCFYDKDDAGGMTPELLRFLDAGPPPVVFTLGSSAVQIAGNFYTETLPAIQRLGCRAVLLVGKDGQNELPAGLPPTVHVAGYAPFSGLFPRARAIVHSGGAGTTGQALRAGKPMLVVPWAHDQPDNAEHARRLGLARVLPAHLFTAGRAFYHLFPLLNDPSYAARAAEIGKLVAAEDGATAAATALETLLK